MWSTAAHTCDVAGYSRGTIEPQPLSTHHRGDVIAGWVHQPRAFAVIGEAAWWVTVVDATLLRYHPEVYDAVLWRCCEIKSLTSEGPT
jgi:hypothetical protein